MALEEIQLNLTAIATQFNCRILLAVENGSRCWGWAGRRSDFDVRQLSRLILRFIYVHAPSRYLTIEEKIVDVIEESRTLADGNSADFQGWDLRKALKLLREGNPVLVYCRVADPIDEMAQIAETTKNVKTVLFAYLSISRKHLKEHFAGKDEIIPKKYLYVVRPLVAVAYLREFGTLPPLSLQDLLATTTSLPGPIKAALLRLVDDKMTDLLPSRGPRSPELDDWVAAYITECETYGRTLPFLPEPPFPQFNAIFYRAVVSQLS